MMSIYDILRKLYHGPRELPSSANDGGAVTIHGLGTFAFVSVGNTTYTTGLDIFFQPEWDDEPASGHVRFKATIDTDYKVAWIIVKRTLDYRDYTGERFGSMVWDNIQKLAEDLYLRAPVSWGFHVSDAAQMERLELQRKFNDLNDRIHLLNEMLAGRARHSRTPEALQRHLAHNQGQLAQMEEHALPRIERLKDVHKAWNEWCADGSKTRNMPIHTVLTNALNGPDTLQDVTVPTM